MLRAKIIPVSEFDPTFGAVVGFELEVEADEGSGDYRFGDDETTFATEKEARAYARRRKLKIISR